MDDIICLTCGASPDLDAPRKIDEWDDAGHSDSAHYPVWSVKSFKGSEWHGHPNNSLWYAELVYEDPYGETDYNYGYADCPDYPDPLLLLPSGGKALEWVVKRNQAHPDHSGDVQDLMEAWTA